MKLDVTELRGVVDRFKDERIEPPFPVLHALASLIGDATVSTAITVHKLARASESSQETGTTWECMALAGDAVVHVSGARTGRDWYLGRVYDEDEDSTPVVIGSLTPLREIATCRVLKVWTISETEWIAKWQFELRNRDPLVIPWPDHLYGQQQHEALALDVAKRLR
ncbi:hypothetical protein OG558_12745 [Kribbella sp. NBC_01510]|uniref:hypothetical protein n=1 Tax=Kribbella sp. NBC_01510 TaxID=2903581 RepID=UPI00386C0AC1